MKLPQIKDTQKYKDLYIVDFGTSTSIGFTAEEVAELLESELFKNIKVYKIYNARPDGTMELKGVPSHIFHLESAMLFYENNQADAERDYKSLVKSSAQSPPPARAKVHLAKYSDEKFAAVIIYPAEYEEQFGRWLLDIDYKTTGSAEGGIDAASRYYSDKPIILQRHQLFSAETIQNKTGQELLAAVKTAFVR